MYHLGMVFLRILPVPISFLLLAAHFLRSAHPLLCLLSLLFPLLLFVRRPWAVRVIQVALVAGSIEWLRTLLALAVARQSLDEPWLRMALILAVVATWTALSILVFRSSRLKEMFELK
jgi:hypothetical protein